MFLLSQIHPFGEKEENSLRQVFFFPIAKNTLERPVASPFRILNWQMLFQRCSHALLLNLVAEITKTTSFAQCFPSTTDSCMNPEKCSNEASVWHASVWQPVVKPKFILPDKTDFSPCLPQLVSDHSSQILQKQLVFPHTVQGLH